MSIFTDRYHKDQRFVTVSDRYYPVGTVVTLSHDDGSACPRFKDAEGVEWYLGLPDEGQDSGTHLAVVHPVLSTASWLEELNPQVGEIWEFNDMGRTIMVIVVERTKEYVKVDYPQSALQYDAMRWTLRDNGDTNHRLIKRIADSDGYAD